MGNEIYKPIVSNNDYTIFFHKLCINNNSDAKYYIDNKVLSFQYMEKTIYVYEHNDDERKLIDLVRCSINDDRIINLIEIKNDILMIPDGNYFNLFQFVKGKIEFIKKFKFKLSKEYISKIKGITFDLNKIYLLLTDIIYKLIMIEDNKKAIQINFDAFCLRDDKIKFLDDMKNIYVKSSESHRNICLIVDNYKSKTLICDDKTHLCYDKYFNFGNDLIMSDIKMKNQHFKYFNKFKINKKISGHIIKIIKIEPVYEKDTNNYYLILVSEKCCKSYLLYGYDDYEILEFDIGDKMIELKNNIYQIESCFYKLNIDRLTKSLLIDINTQKYRNLIKIEQNKSFYKNNLILVSNDFRIQYRLDGFMKKLFRLTKEEEINLEINNQITFFHNLNSFEIFINFVKGNTTSDFILKNMFLNNNDITNKNLFLELLEHLFVYCNIILSNRDDDICKIYLSYLISGLVNRYFVYYDDIHVQNRFKTIIPIFKI